VWHHVICCHTFIPYLLPRHLHRHNKSYPTPTIHHITSHHITRIGSSGSAVCLLNDTGKRCARYKYLLLPSSRMTRCGMTLYDTPCNNAAWQNKSVLYILLSAECIATFPLCPVLPCSPLLCCSATYCRLWTYSCYYLNVVWQVLTILSCSTCAHT
jgi:hypothetical protein